MIRDSAPSSQVTEAVSRAHDARDASGPQPGDVLGFRYRVDEPLGRGGYGDVFRGTDLLGGGPVAVKVLRPSGEGAEPGVPAEVPVLRMLRIPGTVRMLDEGIAWGRPYLVLDFVEGAPFPGRALPCRWDEIAPTVVALLECLDRIHHAGFVHRDLKPDNVLVDADGIPTVLDLGLALPRILTDQEGTGRVVEGTLPYLAPELLDGRAPSPHSDLYSVGVMLAEVLSGSEPVASLNPRNAVSRAFREAASAEAARMGCPEPVIELLEKLTSCEPASRPTAAAALELIGASSLAAAGDRPLPLLGPARKILDRMREAVRDGRSIRLGGNPGTGRSRVLSELARRCEEDGVEVIRVRGAEGVLGPLRALLEGRDAVPADPEQAGQTLQQELRSRLREGAVVQIDDADLLDSWSCHLLEGLERFGSVVRVVTGEDHECDFVIEALGEEDLRELFHGPDRVHHLREDAARLLCDRSGGIPAEITRILGSWMRAGLIRWEGERLSISRESIERVPLLRTRATGGNESQAGAWPEEEEDRSLLSLLWASGGRLEKRRLLALSEQPPWEVAIRLDRLEERGFLAPRPGAAVGLVCSIDLFSRLGAEKVRRLHGKIADALEPGDEGRLQHLAAADRELEIPDETRALASRLRSKGRLGPAFATLVEGLALSRHEAEGGQIPVLLEDLLIVAIELGTVPVLQRALYEIETTSSNTETSTQRLRDLGRAALVGLEGDGRRALELASLAGPFSGVELESARHSVRLICSRRVSEKAGREILEEATSWAAETREPEADYRRANWLGWQRYHELRFREAAEYQLRAASFATTPAQRVGALLSAGQALMEDAQLERAAAVVQDAMRGAVSLRMTQQEARAVVLDRAVRYRSGRNLKADPVLVDEVSGFGSVEAFAALGEAAIAMRGGDLGLAASLARNSEKTWRRLGVESGRCLAAAVAAYCDRQEVRVNELLRSALSCELPGIRVQALGLLWPSLSEGRAEAYAELERASRAIPRDRWEQRREVLSIEEAWSLTKGKEFLT